MLHGREQVLPAIRRWTFDRALPFWIEHGLDREDGGYVELLDENRQASADYKRTRVLARQLYVFSHAAMMGFADGAQASDHGYEFFIEKAWLGPDDGWARRLSREGEVLDKTPDLYDLAFALYGLGWRSRMTGDRHPLDLAHQTLDFIDHRMRHPLGGFLHESPSVGARQQNPHMHLLEAALVLLEASPEDARFRALADELAGLFETRFYQPSSRTLPEFFDENLRPCADEKGLFFEPGHQMEWAWILAQHQRLTGRDQRDLAGNLIESAEAWGVDSNTGVTYNKVSHEGTPLDRGSRTWPNTERIKSAVASAELTATDPWPIISASTNVLFDRYLSEDGTWIDAFDASGAPTVSTTPASTLYHVFLAFSEVLGLSERPAAAVIAR